MLAGLLGLIAGYAALTRVELILLLPILLWIMIYKEKRRMLKFFIATMTVMCLVVSVWTIRNYRIFGRFVLVTTHYADTLWLSTWHEEWLEWKGEAEPYSSMVRGENCIEGADFYLTEAIKNVKEHPFIYLKMCAKRLYRFWLTGHSNTFHFMRDSAVNYFLRGEYPIFLLKLLMLAFNLFIIALGLFGIKAAYAESGREKAFVHCLSLPILFFVAVHFFIFATPRYAVPIMPFVIIFAARAVVGCLNRRRGCDEAI